MSAVNRFWPNRAAAGRQELSDGRGPRSWSRLAQGVLLLVTLAGTICLFSIDYEKRAKGTDFAHVYAAARLVLEGNGHQLYDFATQDQFQIRYLGRAGTYYNHPPFELLLYLPISFWSLQTAYLLWCLLNVGFLACTAIAFHKHIFNRLDWPILLPVFLLFPPVLINFQQGQDSLFLLLIMTLAVVALMQDQNFEAGCWLGCGLFKFHIILPFVLLVLWARRRGFLGGFALMSVTLLLISAGISGWSFLTVYTLFLTKLNGLPLPGIHPPAMANLRGLITVLNVANGARLGLIGSTSLLLFAWTAWKGKSKVADAAGLVFGNFVLAALLVSYHLSPSDVSLVLLPMALFSASLMTSTGIPMTSTGIPRPARLILVALECLILLPPLHLFLLTWHVYAYAAVPILILLAMSAGNGANVSLSSAEMKS
jgi:hypothetical protein